MTDLRVLLHDAAPKPTRHLVFDALAIEAARRRRWRRVSAWLGGLGIVLGLGGGAVGVLAPADRPAQVETLPGPTTVEEIRGPEVEPPSETPRRVDGAPVAAHSATAAPDRTPSAPEEQPAWPGTQPSWEGCVAEGHAEGAELGYNGGLYSTERPTCRYQASRAGGYTGKGRWTLEIRRGVEDIEYRGGESPACMPVGTIQPGDVVTVIVDVGSEGAITEPSYIRAGPDYGCG